MQLKLFYNWEITAVYKWFINNNRVNHQIIKKKQISIYVYYKYWLTDYLLSVRPIALFYL